eukprot:jgi/Ulvmu1/421/UM001_0428.1
MVRECQLQVGQTVVTIIDVGAAIRSVKLCDRVGAVEDVVLGHPSLDDYKVDTHGTYFGCVVGRVANRIAGASFTLPGTDEPVALEANDGSHALHGGSNHWGKRVWQMQECGTPEKPGVTLTLVSNSGDAGYPGKVDARVTYTLEQQEGPVLSVELEAETDSLTPINMVQHTYWNLAGQQRVAEGCLIHDHQLWLNSDSITEVQDDLIPTGNIVDVDTVSDSAMNFWSPKVIGKALAHLPDGMDTHFVLKPCTRDDMSAACEPAGMLADSRVVARLHCPVSGRGFELTSNAPGVQVYTGAFLEGAPGKDGVVYKRFQNVCLETQVFPDSVHHQNFPSPLLGPGDTYRHTMIFRFFTE